MGKSKDRTKPGTLTKKQAKKAARNAAKAGPEGVVKPTKAPKNKDKYDKEKRKLLKEQVKARKKGRPGRKKQAPEEVDAVQAEVAAKNRFSHQEAPEPAAQPAQPHTAPAPSELHAGGDAGPDEGRGRSRSTISLVPAETSTYLSEVCDHFKSLIDTEEKQLLVANVLQEIAGKEQLVAGDPTCSRHVEVLLAAASTGQLLAFTSAALQNGGVAQLASSPFGSHVVDKILVRLGQAYDTMSQEEYDTFAQMLKTATDEVCTELWSFLTDRFATHVARRLLCVLCGADILSAGARGASAAPAPAGLPDDADGEDADDAPAGKRAARGSGGAVPGTAVGGLAARVAADAAGGGGKRGGKGKKQSGGGGAGQVGGAATWRFPDLVQALLRGLTADEAPMYDAVYSPYASPFVQAAMRAAVGLANNRNALSALIPAALGATVVSANQGDRAGKLLESVSVDGLTAMMEDPTASHVVEAALSVMQHVPGLLEETIERFFVGRMRQLALGPKSNFCVQALLAACNKDTQVTSLYSELEPLLTQMLQGRRAGVVAALAAACGRTACKQREFCAALAKALTGTHTDTHAAPTQQQGSPLAAALLTLDCFGPGLPTDAAAAGQAMDVAALCAPRKGPPLAPRLSPLGSVILISVLGFQQGACRDFTDSLLALPAPALALTARDPSGSRTLEAVLDGTAPAKVKSKLLSGMTGGWAVAASSGSGSFFVEKCYTAGDMSVKECIVKELAAAEKPLRSTVPGAKVLQRTGADAYKRDPEQWRRSAVSSTKTLAAFADLFGTADTQPTQQATATHQPQPPATAANGHHAGDEAAGGKKEKRKKDKKRRHADEQGDGEGDQGEPHTGTQGAEGEQTADAAAATQSQQRQDNAAQAEETEHQEGQKKTKKKKHKEQSAGAGDGHGHANGVRDDGHKKKKKKSKQKGEPGAEAAE